ncbi:hypothetical protein GQ607_012094 [Colletotrichum asianum]|uniref:Uncharacterized protein n=2 Tax=Colletotrichum gloeosporioides species complex TaxID=2707338 RepID=A0A8H3W7I7_9PEZI|nr:hypothetical protein GQ607_012094 [Colletotrichum asianum]
MRETFSALYAYE